MDIITCEFCGKTLQVPAEMYGQMVQCPLCKNSFRAQPPEAIRATPPPLSSRLEPPRYADRDDPEEMDRWGEEREELAYRRVAPHRGSTVLTLGILSLVLCGPILGPIAWVMGTNDLKEIAAGRMDRTGEGITRAGQVIGMVATILSILALCIYGAIFVAAMNQGGFR